MGVRVAQGGATRDDEHDNEQSPTGSSTSPTNILPRLSLQHHTSYLAAPPYPLHYHPGAPTIAVRPSSRAADIIAAFYFIAQPTG